MSAQPDRSTGPAEPSRRERLLVAARRGKEAWEQLWLRIQSITPATIARLLLVLVAVWLIAWIIRQAFAALIPFQVGLVLAYLLLPLVNRLEARMPRWAAILMVFLVSLLVLGGSLAYLIPVLIDQFRTLLGMTPSPDQIRALLDRLNERVMALQPQTQELIRNGLGQFYATVRANIATYATNAINFVVNTFFGLMNTIGFLFGFLIIPFWLFYTLKDEKAGRVALNRLLPGWMRADFWAVLRIVDRVFSGFIRGQLLLGLAIAVLVFVGLNLLSLFGVQGIHSTLILAIFAGITEFIPYIGPILGAIPAVIMGLFTSWETTIAIAILYLIIQQIENTFLVPKISGDNLEIHPAVLVVVLVALSQFGFIYIVLAGPIAAIARDLFKYVYGRFEEPPRPAGVIPGTPEWSASSEALSAPADPLPPPPVGVAPDASPRETASRRPGAD